MKHARHVTTESRKTLEAFFPIQMEEVHSPSFATDPTHALWLSTGFQEIQAILESFQKIRFRSLEL